MSIKILKNTTNICVDSFFVVFGAIFFLFLLAISANPVSASPVIENLENGSTSAYGTWSNPSGSQFVQNNPAYCAPGPAQCSNPFGLYSLNGCACSLDHFLQFPWPYSEDGSQSNIYTFNESFNHGSISFYTQIAWWQFGSTTPVEIGFNGSSQVKIFYQNNPLGVFDVYCLGSGDPIKIGMINYQFQWFQVGLKYLGSNTADCYLNGIKGGSVSVPQNSSFNSIKFSNSAVYDVDDISADVYPSNLTIFNLKQYSSNGLTEISENEATNQNTFVFKGMLESPVGANVQLQVEVQPSTEPFTNTPTAIGDFVQTENIALAVIPDLPNGSYHCQARGIDTEGNPSAWQVGQTFTVTGSRPTNETFIENLENGPISAQGTWSNPAGNQFTQNSSCGTGPAICSNPSNTYDYSGCACSLDRFFQFQWPHSDKGDISNTFIFNYPIFNGSIGFYTRLNWWEFGSIAPVDIGFAGNSIVKISYQSNLAGTLDIYCQGTGEPVKIGIIEHQYQWFQINIKYNGTDTADCYLNGQKGGTVFVPQNSLFNSIKFNNSAVYDVDDISESFDSAKRNPVIIVPGILGSQKVLGIWKIDPILLTYGNLLEALKISDYKENKTLFTFPYDWRQSNIASSLLLKQKIDKVKIACSAANLDGYDCSKVDLVAHSMGGLVARAYAESDNYQNDIDQLIFLATPQRGAPNAYLGWEGGYMGKGPRNYLIETLLGLQASYESIKYTNVFEYVRNFPIQSVQELLPTYNYLLDKGSTDYRIYPDNYPINTFLENLNAPINLDKLSSIKITNILANAGSNNTINSLRLVNKNFSNGQWENGYPEGYDDRQGDHGLIMGNGDNTVPKISNSNFLGKPDVIIENSSHMDIPTDAQREVIKDLTGVEPKTEIRYYPLFMVMKTFLIFAIHSPADFVITSPNGQRLGKDFANNAEINQIPNAYYSGFTDEPEFVVITNPIDGQYKIELQGKNDGGSYQVQAIYIDESTTTEKDFSANIAPNQSQIFNLDCASNSPQAIIDLTPQDIVPPTIVINNPIIGAKYFHSDKLEIDYAASDDFSGIASIVVATDDNVLSTTTVDLFNYALGFHKISIKVADKAGNQSEEIVNLEIIANIDSAIYDIKTAYSKKWLIKEADKNILVFGFEGLKISLNLLAAEKEALRKLINDTQNNQKLSVAAKKKIVDSLNKLLDANARTKQLLTVNGLNNLQKVLDTIKARNGINQLGYDIIKADINYLKINL